MNASCSPLAKDTSLSVVSADGTGTEEQLTTERVDPAVNAVAADGRLLVASEGSSTIDCDLVLVLLC